MSQPLKVSGEDLDTLFEFFHYLEATSEESGLISMAARNVPLEVMTPFFRAVMRREARLLLEDADAMDDTSSEPRTAQQRRADAFVDVMVNVAGALRYSPPDGSFQARPKP